MQGSHVVEMFPSSAAHYPIAKFPRHFATVLLLIDDLLDVIKSLWWLVFSQNACDLERKNKNSCELHQKKTNINDAKTRPKEVEKQTDPGLVCAGRASISCSLSISEKPLAPKIVRSSLAFDTYIVYPPVHEGVPHPPSSNLELQTTLARFLLGAACSFGAGASSSDSDWVKSDSSTANFSGIDDSGKTSARRRNLTKTATTADYCQISSNQRLEIWTYYYSIIFKQYYTSKKCM